MPRFARPGDQIIAAEAELAVPVANIAAAARACLVVEHNPAIEIVAVREADSQRCWDLQHTGPGLPAITLIDAGEMQSAEQLVSVACGPVANHDTALLRLSVRGRNTGNYTVKTRVVMQVRDASYLNSPYSVGVDDVTGFLAWSQNWRVTQTTDAQSDPCLATADAGQSDAVALDTSVFDAASADIILADRLSGDLVSTLFDGNLRADAAHTDVRGLDLQNADSRSDAGLFHDAQSFGADSSQADKYSAGDVQEQQACNCSAASPVQDFRFVLIWLLACAAMVRRYMSRVFICDKKP